MDIERIDIIGQNGNDGEHYRFLIGEKVVYEHAICIVEKHEVKTEVWIHNTSRGYSHWVAPHNLKRYKGEQE